MTAVCEHGQLKRSCEMCFIEQERDVLQRCLGRIMEVMSKINDDGRCWPTTPTEIEDAIKALAKQRDDLRAKLAIAVKALETIEAFDHNDHPCSYIDRGFPCFAECDFAREALTNVRIERDER